MPAPDGYLMDTGRARVDTPRHHGGGMTHFHTLRTAAPAAVLALLISLGLTACASGDPALTTAAGRASTSASSSTATAAGPDHLNYVAFGASWPYGAHCGMCQTFVSYYATYVEQETGIPVDFDNRTTNGGDTHDFLDTLQTDEAARASVAQADIVLINGGINDLDRTGALDKVVAGTCGGDGSRWGRLTGLPGTPSIRRRAPSSEADTTRFGTPRTTGRWFDTATAKPHHLGSAPRAVRALDAAP